jgi:hypothetical protein
VPRRLGDPGDGYVPCTAAAAAAAAAGAGTRPLGSRHAEAKREKRGATPSSFFIRLRFSASMTFLVLS